MLSNFKRALNNFLQLHSFCTLVEYFGSQLKLGLITAYDV